MGCCLAINNQSAKSIQRRPTDLNYDGGTGGFANGSE